MVYQCMDDVILKLMGDRLVVENILSYKFAITSRIQKKITKERDGEERR